MQVIGLKSKNTANYPIDLTQFKCRIAIGTMPTLFPVGTILQPGDRIIVAEDVEKFSSLFPNVLNKIGGTGFRLDNSR
jgi:hypothetical protein